MPHQRIAHRFGIHHFIVVKAHAFPQGNDQAARVFPAMASRQLRDDFQFFVDVKKLVTQRGIDDATDKGA